jgi:hypothetical protein
VMMARSLRLMASEAFATAQPERECVTGLID